MEENVALDSRKQKKFIKSIKGIKKLIKKNEGKTELPKKDEKIEPQKPFSMKLKGGKIKKKKRKQRGLVYLSHIPHGFYEHQMVQYFKQFGVVTNARVIRSKRTGNSKGYAFVEFKEPAVGQIVAETMNNYLMGKRLIKAAYIPPEKQRVAYRKHWNSVYNPGSQLRLKMKKDFNAVKDDNAEIKRARKLLSNLTKNKKKLSEIGINYDFFIPVDIPEGLLNTIVKQEKNNEDSVSEEKNNLSKAKKGDKQPESNNNVSNNKKQNTKQLNKTIDKNTKDTKKPEVIEKEASSQNKKEKAPEKINKKQQKEKEQKLKTAGIKPPEEFIKIQDTQDSDEESDSSYDFDSDEYEKVLEAEDSDLSSGENENEEPDDDIEEEEEEEGDEDPPSPPKKQKQKSAPKQVQLVQSKKRAQNPQTKLNEKKPVEVKRKIPQKNAAPSKKQKFEKLNQKPMKKQFKKK